MSRVEGRRYDPEEVELRWQQRWAERGDMPAAIAAIRRAMEQLAALGSVLDPNEGAMMRFIAERFTEALGAGNKGDAKTVVDVMRRNAGDTSDTGGRKNDW